MAYRSNDEPEQPWESPSQQNPRVKTIIANNGSTPPPEAIKKLSKIAELMIPVMARYDLRIELLAEVAPQDEPQYWGYNSGKQIYLRLENVPWDLVVDNMMHELVHNWHLLHDHSFYRKLGMLRDCFAGSQVEPCAGGSPLTE